MLNFAPENTKSITQIEKPSSTERAHASSFEKNQESMFLHALIYF